MGLFEHFPYTNFHELNLDWIVNQIKSLSRRVRKLEETQPEPPTPPEPKPEPQKNIVVIGDSWVDSKTTTSHSLAGELVAHKLGLKCFNYAVSGSGFYRTEQPQNFLAQVVNAHGNMSTEEIENTEYVLLVGGVNDRGYELSNVLQSCANTIQAINDNFPNSTLIYVCDTATTVNPDDNALYNSLAYTIENYSSNIIMTTDWSPYGLSMTQEYYQDDGLHLTSFGQIRLANLIVATINKSKIIPMTNCVEHPWVTIDNSYNARLDSLHDVSRMEEIVTCSYAYFYFGTIPIGSATKIGTINPRYIPRETLIFPLYGSDFTIVGSLILANFGDLLIKPFNTGYDGARVCGVSYRAWK